MMRQIHEAHPAEGKDHAAECSCDEEEGQEEAVVSLQHMTFRVPSLLKELSRRVSLILICELYDA